MSFLFFVANIRLNYITRNRKILTYIEEGDTELLSLDSEPEIDAENHKEWLGKSNNVNISIIISIGEIVMAKFSEIVEYRKKLSKDIWGKLCEL